jgi:hypothetical protein
LRSRPPPLRSSSPPAATRTTSRVRIRSAFTPTSRGTGAATTIRNVSSLCTSGTATASFRQNGNELLGTFKATGCGISGAFRGTVTGNSLTGTVDMIGCTGGAVSGQLEEGQLTFAIGDFQKVLLTGDAEVLPGGQARLQR